MFGILPAYGLFCRHVDGITIRDCNFSYNDTDKRPVMLFDDVHHLNIDNLTARIDPDIPAQIVFRQSSNVMVSNCRPPTARAFLCIGRQSDTISVMGNDLSSVRQPFIFDPSVPESAVYSEFNRLPSPR